MQNTKFRRNRPAGYGEEDFKRDFTLYEPGGHLGQVTSIKSTNLIFHVPKSLHKQIV